MNTIASIRSLLQSQAKPKDIKFFKIGPGHYAQHDQFIGVTVPQLRSIAKKYAHLELDDIQKLLESPFNEERLLALFILVNQYKKADEPTQDKLYLFYIKHLKQVNNWNLVDSSAHLIIGAHLLSANKSLLLKLAASPDLWERRIAIVATLYFIRHGQLEWTFKIAEKLLADKHDLIHKSVGWILREAGKKDIHKLTHFLDKYTAIMPRTMLRYAIEKLSPSQKQLYLNMPTKE